MLRETLAGSYCLLCKKPQGYRHTPICLSCLKRLPPPKKLSHNQFIVFAEEVEIPQELVPPLAASRYFELGGKTDGVLNKEDSNLSFNIAWHLRVPLVDYPSPQTLVIEDEYRGKQILDSLQYLFLKSPKDCVFSPTWKSAEGLQKRIKK